MIRQMTARDIERMGEIWLKASIKAHDFVPQEFWRANLETMTRDLLPQCESYVHLNEGNLDAFITLDGDDVIHCLFVEPSRQQNGVGSLLLSHVKQSRKMLRLKVYTS